MNDRITSALNKRSTQPASLTETISRAMLGKSTFGQALNQIKAQDLQNLTAEMNLDLAPKKYELAEREFDFNQMKFLQETGSNNQKAFEDRFKFWADGLDKPSQVKLYEYARDHPDQVGRGNADSILSGGIKDLGLKVTKEPKEGSMTPIKVADPTSSTGFSWKVPATGKVVGEAPPSGGLSVKFNPKTGEFEASTGGADYTKKTKSTIEDKRLTTSDALSNVRRISAAFKPEYQQIMTRWGAFVTAAQEKSEGVPVLEWVSKQFGEGDRELLRDFTIFKRRSFEEMNRTLHDLSGAAISAHEFERLKQQLPNPGSGFFDGDSPTQFESKLADLEMQLRLVQARYAYAQKNGFDPLEMDLLRIEDVMNQRWKEIYRGLPGNLSDDEKVQQTDMTLMDEFDL